MAKSQEQQHPKKAFGWAARDSSGVLPSISQEGRKMVGGSNIGGVKETQEMIDFVAKHNITAEVEVIPIDYVNTAMERLAKVDVRYQFVIDVGSTLKPPGF
ncbi:unnamed protein product [Prunus armeniaca]|uniref:Alcohol dehydrogenase-like C-terminal domain-containing protein n=1 Tax=Prunus armeniaca TaxID=36596 RepID=A0A6J5V7Z6_PRUAR|nr:unnamed protein product [Prunus armeniaca]